VGADVATDGNQQTARMIEQAGDQSLAVSCNVTRTDDIKAALDAAVERFGRLDIAFNNAGIEQPIKPAAEISDDVVGAGPTGLTMAIELARRGVVVRLIERLAKPPPTSRALLVQPRTLELFDDMGVIDAALAAGRPVDQFTQVCGAAHWFSLTSARSWSVCPRCTPPTPGC
jgi:FAD binding domain